MELINLKKRKNTEYNKNMKKQRRQGMSTFTNCKYTSVKTLYLHNDYYKRNWIEHNIITDAIV